MEDIGEVSTFIEDGVHYEITIVDGEGVEFYEEGACSGCTASPAVYLDSLNEIANCTCDGQMAFNFNDIVEGEETLAVIGCWSDGNGNKQDFEIMDTIPNNAFFLIEGVRTVPMDYFILIENNCPFILTEGNVSDFCPTPYIEAHTDITTTSPTDAVTFNVLENDIGEGIFIKGITKPPFCGTTKIVDAQEGIIQYTPNESCSDKLLSFDYQIEDIDGNSAIGTVKIAINQDGSEMVVTVERDCCANVRQSGVYPLNVYVVDRVPPFIISGSINAIMEDFGTAGVEIEDGLGYEISVVDAVGNEFHEMGGEIPCNHLGGSLCSEISFDTNYIVEEGYLDCLCDGSVVVSLTHLVEVDGGIQKIYGFWYLGDEIQPIEWRDTIPPHTYFQIFEVQTNHTNYLISTIDENDVIQDFLGGLTSNFCYTPCIEAIDDSYSLYPNNSITINPLENDIGEEIQLIEIINTSEYGEIEINPETGDWTYTSNLETPCIIDEYEYIIEDAFGQRDTAIVEFKITYETLNVLFDFDPYRACDNFEITIYGGCPPYALAGDIDTLLNEGETFGEDFPVGIEVTVKIEDSFGSSILFEDEPLDCHHCPFIDHIPPCNPDCEVVEIEVMELQYLCNGDGTVNVGFLDIIGGSGNYSIYDNSPWWASSFPLGDYIEALIVDENNCYSIYYGSIPTICELEAQNMSLSAFTNQALTFTFSQQDYWTVPNQIRLIDVTTPQNGNVEWTAEGAITYISNEDFVGTENFSYTIRDESSGAEQTANITVEVLVAVGIDGLPSSLTHLQLYPNPNKGNFTLSLQSKQAEVVEIQVIDILGQAKIRRYLQSSVAFERQDFNLDFPSGLYFLQVSGKNWRWTEKIIIK